MQPQAQENDNNENVDNEQTIISNASNNNNHVYGTFAQNVIIAGTLTSPVTSTTKLLSDNDDPELENQSCFVNPINGCAASIGSCVFPTTLYLKNDASTARDNFSIERNFLSWLRISTSFNLIGLSIYFRFHLIPPPAQDEIARLENQYSKPIGMMFIVCGLFLLCWAVWQYFGFQRMLATRVMRVENSRLNFCIAFFVGLLIFSALVVNIVFENARPRKGFDSSVNSTFITTDDNLWFGSSW
ncbi:7306_t:CDS:2 [Ambispora leptoticha]|uniref:7306_t:CDS:1 n=1 Tax=Ambispora leptoticha TaxID=144679 RepID=A0A9N9AUN5_9GLOM|nr:7306_t:CDS:2 [Ambispora leptoticha]